MIKNRKTLEKQTFLFACLGIFLFASFMLLFPEGANALRLTENRIIFDESKRSDNLIIVNKSNKPETYRLYWREMDMRERGGLRLLGEEEVAQKKYKVGDMVKYSPRRITVPAKSSQQVRLVLRRPGDLPDGEYRSHFSILTEKNISDIRGEGGKSALVAVPGISIPVFVRKGNLEGTLSLKDLRAEQDNNILKLSFTMTRSGNKTVYGRFQAICNAGSDDSYVAKFLRRVPVYTNISQRFFDYKVEIKPEQSACRTLKVRLLDEREDKTILLAEESVTVL